MKKIFVFIANTLVVFSFFAPISASALAQVAPTPTDYSTGCLLTNGAKTFSQADTSEAPNSGGQAFKPTTNRITKITVYMEYSAINKVGLLLFTNDQYISSSPVFPVTNETGYTPGQIYPVSYDLDAAVNPGQEYMIVLVVQEGTAKWKYIENDGSCDPTGNARVNLVNGLTTDMTYMVQGYNYVAPATTAATTTTVAPAANTDSPTTTKKDTTTTTKPKDAVQVDATIAKPALVSYALNGKTTNGPVSESVNITKGEKIKLTGTSFAGAEVTIFYGDTSSLATTKADGSWKIEIDSKKMNEGDSTISAQAKKGEKGSEIVDLIPVRVLGVNNVVADTNSEKADTLNPYVLYSLIGLLVIIISLIAYLELKHKVISKLFRKKEPHNE